MKKIFRYVILLIIVYIAVSFFTYFITKPRYKHFTNYEILAENPRVEITECRTSYAKGFIKGHVVNTTGKIIDDACIKATIYDKNGKFLGEEYYSIPYFNPQEKTTFNISYAYKNVGKIGIDVVEGKPKTFIEETFADLGISEENSSYVRLVGTLVLLYGIYVMP